MSLPVLGSCALLGGCLAEASDLEEPADESAPAASIESPATGDPNWRDLGGYQLNLVGGNGTPSPTGWKFAACAPSYGVLYDRFNTTYFPGMVRPGSYVVFKQPNVSIANFDKYWQLTAGAPPLPPEAVLVERKLYVEASSQTVAVSVGDTLVNAGVAVGGFSGCYRRTSPTGPFVPSYTFNATPGTGDAVAGTGLPYITELCTNNSFWFVEVFVP